TTREELLGIHPGSEFEIRGYGKMSGRALTSVGRRSFSSGIGPFYAASVGGNALWEGNLILKMKVLDHQGKVEMFVIRDENRTGRLEARLNAGFGLDPTSMPTLGKGYLGALARKKGSKSISRCLKRFGGADFKAYWQDTSQENGMGRYVLDIRTPDGLCAYTSLLGLEVDKAESLSVIQNSGVKSIGYHSTEENSEVGLEASLGASVLLLYRALEAERSGELSKNGKETTCFRENKFKKVSGNFMTGKRTVCWDSVTLSENAKSPTTFYNLKFTNEDKITTEKEIERFFNFAKTLGIKEAHKSRRELPKTMSDFSRAFANEDDTKVEVDIYFAKAGIDKIATTSNEEARKVILASRAQFDPTAKGLKDLSASQFRMALSSVEKYRDSEIKSSVDEVGGDWSMMQVEEEYRKRLGRSLVADMPHLEEAKNFMHHKEGLTAAATPEERRDFFVQLGGDKGFGFMPAISALATLAGEKDSVINTLRMRGGEVELEAVSEGRIAHSTLMGVREFEAVEVF
ncbi:MAG: hypothetical protein VYA34_06570, partial [Myxococcota bacterium]|nr:hypothetical protein [Myxococcota bacterium]